MPYPWYLATIQGKNKEDSAVAFCLLALEQDQVVMQVSTGQDKTWRGASDERQTATCFVIALLIPSSGLTSSLKMLEGHPSGI